MSRPAIGHFKDTLRKKWCDWMVDGDKEFTKGGAMKAVSLTTVSRWASDSWSDIPDSMALCYPDVYSTAVIVYFSSLGRLYHFH